MENPFWLKALFEACLHAHHPALHYQTEEGIVKRFLWFWEEYPSPISPPWEQFVDQGRDYESRSDQDIFAILQRAVIEGEGDSRVFALFLLGGLATPKARDLLISFLKSPQRKERWASVIALGRLKEERVFSLLQTLLLEGFAASEIFASVEELQAAQEACRLSRQMYKEQGQAMFPESYEDVIERLRNIDYEWYLRQRSECALALGTWGNPSVVPKLQEALQTAWRMEQDWPDYEGPDASGPKIWYFFQDYLAFALGQLGAWDALQFLHFPENHLLVARIYMILGALQVNDTGIFYEDTPYYLLHDSPSYLQTRARMEKAGVGVHPFVEPARVKRLLAEYFGLSLTEQEKYLVRYPKAWNERGKESHSVSPPEQWTIDPFLAADQLERE